jgi:hypothetical protein
MSTSSPFSACSKFLSVGLVFLAGTFFGSTSLHAQSAAPAKAPSSGTASGFAIETEMLTYRALESNGEAIACDVAAYLYGTKPDFKSLPSGSICNVGPAAGTSSVGIVVLPFDHVVFNDFQIWRSDMQTMAEFEARGANACEARPAPGEQAGRPQGVTGRGLTTGTTSTASTAAAVGGVMGAMTPAGAILATGSGILGLFAKSQAAEPTGGTIEDQAFMNNVSRELRSVNLNVIMPDVYTPYALTSVDATHSPFVIALDKLFRLRDCLTANKSSGDLDVKNIDEFLASLAAAPAAPAAPARPATATTTAAVAATTPTVASASTAPSRLESALNADGLALRLGADPLTGRIPPTSPQHLLMVKALESGGSVNHSNSIFGSKLSYSGGSVGTYTLFNLSGQLECSGNVYDYAGPINAADFEKHLKNYKPSPGDQVIFQRGACAPLH